MKKLTFILFCIFQISRVLGQEKDYIIGYQRQYYNVVELGFALAERDEFRSYKNFHICGEVLMKHNETTLYGIKAGVDYTLVIFNFTGQAGYYFNGDHNAFLIRPELGFSIFAFADLTYGYSLFLYRENVDMINHVVSFRFKIPYGN